VRRLEHRPLVPLAWSLRKNLSAYDALYVAAARLHDAHLLSADGPLSRAPRLGVVIENVRA
jgi:predicted nucleic acid-binding protein